MMPTDIHRLPIDELAPRLRSRRLTSREVTEACLAEITLRNGELNAFVSVAADRALESAETADREMDAGRYRGALHGVPISLKDLVDVAGEPTSAGSRLRDGHLARKDAAVVSRLREAGAVLVGKCNLHEFAFGTTSEDSAFGPVHNPLDPSRSAGGSSGGSAAAVVSGMSFASVGTDTGGSIRIPAAACGCVGLKPTYGELPTEGIVPLSWSLDHVGPLARTVGDAWLVFHAMAGQPLVGPLVPAGRRRLDTMTLGVLRPYFCDLLDDGVRAAFEGELERLRREGARIVEVSVPHADEIASIYLHIQLPEASAYHATALESHPDAYTPPVRLRLQLGRYVLAEDYVRAVRGQQVLRAEVDRALEDCDALVLPTLPIPPQPLGATTVAIDGGQEPVRALMLRETQLFDLSGHPAITIPYGRTASGLPCGLQLVGRRGRTDGLLMLAYACESRRA